MMPLDEPIINGDNFFLIIEDIPREQTFWIIWKLGCYFRFLVQSPQVTGNIKRNIKML